MKALLFLLLVYCPFFLHLGDLPVRIWDEARLIANTLAMAENGNFLVPHFEGAPDMWNTKPPLMIWLQLIFLKLIGNEELSFRLPSAIAGLFTTLLIMWLFTSHIRSYWFGLIAVLVLITTKGYIGDHVARTGDYDALLTLFTTFFAISFFLFTETGRQRYLHLFFAGLFLAVMTKSVQGMLFLPALFLYLLISKSLIKFLKNKWLYIDSAIIIILVAFYYLLRESSNPGYIDAVKINELGGRYLATTEDHRQEFTYYLHLLLNTQFAYWFLFVPAGFFTGIYLTSGIIKRLMIFSGILSMVYLLIISAAGTKLAWYDAPLYPLLSVMAALLIYRIFSLLLTEIKPETPIYKLWTPYLFLFIVFLFPYQQILSKVYKPRETEKEAEFYTISHFLQDAVNGKHQIPDHVLCYEGYNVHLKYYTDRLTQKQLPVSLKDTNQLVAGDQVITSQYFTREFIRKKFIYREQENYYNVKIFSIDGIRNKDN